MPTIPPFTEPTHPDAWHHVITPGGYECWRFEADDREHDRHLVIRFWHGCIDHPEYLRAYWLYRKFPTRIAPPLPEQFVGVQMVLYELGRVRYRAAVRYPADSFAAATDATSVNIGPNKIDPLADQNLRLTLSLDRAGAEIVFRPKFTHPVQSHCFGTNHHWLMTHPVCDIEGTIDLGGSTILINGVGFHDHHLGSAPPQQVSRNWLSGHVFDQDALHAFELLDNGACLMQADADSFRATSPDIQYSGEPRMTGQMIRYPTDIDLNQLIHLSNPRVVDATLTRTSLIYDAVLREGRPLKAWCEIARPGRAWLGGGWSDPA